MVEQALCMHNSACRTFERFNGETAVYGYGCQECGMKVTAGTWEDARAIFALRAERQTVRHLVQRRGNGEALTERERLMINHSPFGDANGHNF